MLSTIVSILIFIVPIAVFLAIQFFSQQSRTKGHWPQPKETEGENPGVPGSTPGVPRRKARTRAPRGPSCEREFTHLLLTIVGARDSCRQCAALEQRESKEPIDLLAEAERIANEAQD